MLKAGSRKNGKPDISPRRKSASASRRLGSKRRAHERSSGYFASPTKISIHARATRQLGRLERSPKTRTPREADYETALANFETATRYFSKRNYEKAAAFFKKVLDSTAEELIDRAKVRLRFCEQMHRHEPSPRTSEDYYLRGVAALNSQDAEQAIVYLQKSDKMGPNQEHVHYALAAAHARQCNLGPALQHLEAAIELRPANRVQARRDEDFRIMAGDPRFERLLKNHIPQPAAVNWR
jgi:tetratricopeptide (TPR) repeat protein